jgi:hypothetical protein
MTASERDELIITLVNSAAEESRRKNEAFALAMREMEARIKRLERKVRKKR